MSPNLPRPFCLCAFPYQGVLSRRSLESGDWSLRRSRVPFPCSPCRRRTRRRRKECLLEMAGCYDRYGAISWCDGWICHGCQSAVIADSVLGNIVAGSVRHVCICPRWIDCNGYFVRGFFAETYKLMIYKKEWAILPTAIIEFLKQKRR